MFHETSLPRSVVVVCICYIAQALFACLMADQLLEAKMGAQSPSPRCPRGSRTRFFISNSHLLFFAFFIFIQGQRAGLVSYRVLRLTVCEVGRWPNHNTCLYVPPISFFMASLTIPYSFAQFEPQLLPGASFLAPPGLAESDVDKEIVLSLEDRERIIDSEVPTY
ncbi:hypothetical protein B0I35DRAFT_102593 [Stachybotrys elegans]|uniref:Uncharacterized protein n=1 Tax=Stachybotrys elegans TaxID=80388 RepID=A0A8K0SLD6_9HYPO|nr:hypothetical protein B0I35DRAFT_102593 [Stachybotrys elegans]